MNYENFCCVVRVLIKKSSDKIYDIFFPFHTLRSSKAGANVECHFEPIFYVFLDEKPEMSSIKMIKFENSQKKRNYYFLCSFFFALCHNINH